jgi:amino acid transporter
MSQYPPPPPGQYPPPSGYGYPSQGGQPAWQEPAKGKGLAITALVLGILAVLSCWTLVGGYLFGALAIIFGLIAVLRSGGKGMAITGLILGAIGLIATIVITIVGYSFFVNTGGKDFFDCVNKAGNDQSKIDQCEREWNNKLEDRFSITLTPAPR